MKIKQYNEDGTVNEVRNHDDCVSLLETFVAESNFPATRAAAQNMLVRAYDRFELSDGEYLMWDQPEIVIKQIYTVHVNGIARYHGVNQSDALETIIAAQEVGERNIQVQRNTQEETR